MTQLHEQLKNKITELEQIRRIKDYSAALQSRLHEEEHALAIMEQTLDKEQRDVEKLEREGLQTMFRKFLGDREEQLEKEREEYLKVSLRFNELYKSVELIRYELNLLSMKEKNAEAVQGEINVLMEQRAEELMQCDPVASQTLKGIHHQTDHLHTFSAQITEATLAGQQVSDLIRKAEHYLQEAQRWGTRDIWGTNMQGSGQLKHQSIDHAKDLIIQTRHALIRFVNELNDVHIQLELPEVFEVESFSRFTDIFFDNLITDWMVQLKINKSLTNVSHTRARIDQVMHQLNVQRSNINQKLAELEKSRKETIVNSE